MTTPEIKAAEAKLKVAQERVYDAEAALDSEKIKVKLAREELDAARLDHDKALPRAFIKVTARYSGKVEKHEVCIVKRSEKTAFVRALGGDGSDQYRLDKSGTWNPYPAPKSHFGAWRELILKGGAA